MKKKKQTKKAQPKKLDYKKLYWVMIRAFNLAANELYDRTFTMKSDEQLQKFKEYLIKQANKENQNDTNGKVCTKA